jgi:SAM-dependent methyltransferase
MADLTNGAQAFWDDHARRDPLWAILSDPSKAGRRWDLRDFLETGRREVSLLMYQLRALNIGVSRRAALDFGCGVGRLSQPLARYFDRVVGVDVSPEMIRLADEINQFPARVRYLCNSRDDLAVLPTSDFTFMYSNVVLQHIEPATTLRYLRELFRVIAPGGVLVFQLPSHPRPPEEQRQGTRHMAHEAYRASVRVEGHVPEDAAPGAEIVLAVSVTNISAHAWSRQEAGPIRVGNHWLAGRGDEMLIQDDGRASLPDNLAPGETCRLALKITVPPEPGEYQLECDVVHEGVSWFADKGSNTCRGRVRVAGSTNPQSLSGADELTLNEPALSLSDDPPLVEAGALPMYGVHREVVETLIRQNDSRVVHLETDERCGKEWVGYRYFVRKDD